MLRLRGSQAYSSFRIEKLLGLIQTQFPSVQSIDTEYQHLVKLKDEQELLDNKELTKLEKLLSYGPKMAKVEHQGQRIFSLPRFGTISPWSTKATDIAHHCGLTKIDRVERGIAFYISASKEFDGDGLNKLAQLLHDPMTESVVFELDQAEQLFKEEEPKPLFEVLPRPKSLAGLFTKKTLRLG